MMIDGPSEGYREDMNGAAMARRMRPGHKTIIGFIGIELEAPTQFKGRFRPNVAVLRILQLRAARGIPDGLIGIETACDFESL
jgi:hypothetical protein